MEEFAEALYAEGEATPVQSPKMVAEKGEEAGASENTEQQEAQQKEIAPENQEKKKRNKLFAILGGVAAAALVFVIILMASLQKKATDQPLETSGTVENEEKLSVGIARIYLDEQNYAPAAKDTVPRYWDKTLFYTLEDVDPTSDTDGQISGYQLSKKQFLEGDSDSLIQYEIYKNPSTGQIEKVIAVKYAEGMADITDYYFQNEILNFIFHRTDSVYTPTYATPKKPGQRYYFSENHLIKSRDVWAPNQGIDWVVALEDNPTFPQTLYSELSQSEQEAFDSEEQKWLNEAYNVLTAMKEYDGIGTVTGSVIDREGNPLKGISVALEWEQDSTEDLFHATTDDAGIYTVYVPLSETEGVLTFSGEGYREQRVYGVQMNEKTLTLSEPVILLAAGKENSQPVTLSFLDAEAGDSGSVNGNLVIREGADNTKGEAVVSEAITAGVCSVSLTPGTYTAELQADRYGDIYRTFRVGEKEENNVRFHCVPQLTDSAIWITLEWDSPEDLDLCLFLPEWGVDGDMKYVNATSPDSGNGVHLVEDGTGETEFEVVSLDSLAPGTYKLYVSDYENAVGGNLTANALSASGAVVRIYSAQGQVAEYYIPVNQSGVIWEVLEIQNGSIYPVQRCYSNIEGKTWWSEDKHADQAWREAYRESLKNGIFQTEWGGEFNIWDYDHEYGWSNFGIQDLNGDGVPELLINYFDGNGDFVGFHSTTVYTTDNGIIYPVVEMAIGDVKSIPELSGFGYGTGSDYSDGYGFYSFDKVGNPIFSIEVDETDEDGYLYYISEERAVEVFGSEGIVDEQTFRQVLAERMGIRDDSISCMELMARYKQLGGPADSQHYSLDQIDEAIDAWGK